MRVMELESEAPAVKALGSLFKLTQVFLWDDASGETRERVPFRELTGNLDETSSDAIFMTTDCNPFPVDVELTGQMSALGLPLSFQTNKERRNGVIKGKTKDMKKKHLHGHEGSDDGVPDLIKGSKAQVASSTVLHNRTSDNSCSMSRLGHSESSYCDMVEDLENLTAGITCVAVDDQLCDGVSGIMSNCSLDCGSELSSVVSKDNMKTAASPNNSDAGTSPGSIIVDHDMDHRKKEHDGGSMEFARMEGSLMVDFGSEGMKFYSDICSGQPQGPGFVACSRSSEVLDHDGTGSQYYGDFGDWTSYWDSFYMRYYFYNVKTHESTWDPPLGMEHLVFNEVIEESEEIIGEITETNSFPAVSFHHSKPLDYCGLQCDSDSFGKSKNPKSLDQLPTEPSIGFEFAGDNFLDLTPTPPLNFSSELLNEIQRISKNCCHESLSQFLSERMGSFTGALIKALPEDNCNGNVLLGTMDPATDKLETKHNLVARKLKTKARKRTRLNRNLSCNSGELQFQGLLEDFSPSITKYWCQRYLLFSRFDEGIRMDEEGWFSVTPESLARHHAIRCGTGIIVDCFTGVGGNAIQFAHRSKHVVAIDIDPKKIDYAQHNAAIYGVDDRIDFLTGDSFLLAPGLKADTVFLSPPWGGPDYAKVTTYDIKTMLKPLDGYALFNVARGIASKVVMFLPRNVDLNQLAELSLSANPPWSLEVEKNFLNGKLKAITAYYTDTSV